MEDTEWKKDQKPYYVFKCVKCGQHVYVSAKQKTKKCLRCGRTHQVKNIREKKIKSETVLGLTIAVNKVKELQNAFAIQELGKIPDLRTEKDFHVFKQSKSSNASRINKKNELENSEIVKKALQKLFNSYPQVPYYLIELAAEESKISKSELRIAISELERTGFLTRISDNYYKRVSKREFIEEI